MTGNVLTLAAMWVLGVVSGSRQRSVIELRARTAELEVARDELARRAVVEERLRIARELHDVVAHALSVVTVRAGVAAHVAESRPEEVVPALAAIETAARGVHAALRAGASGFILKDTPPGELLDAIRVVARGEALLAPTVTRRLIEEFLRQPDGARGDPKLLGRLTEREREVLTLVARGLSNAEISAHLVVSTATAKTHVSRILAKLDARDRAQLVVLAYASGLMARS